MVFCGLHLSKVIVLRGNTPDALDAVLTARMSINPVMLVASSNLLS